MKCNHCGSEWTTAAENQKDTCPFCGKQITRITTGQSSPVDKFFDEQIRKIQEQQGKDIRWAKLLGCKPDEKPWIINSNLDFIEERRIKKLAKRIGKIKDQELLAHIVKETNKRRVRRAAIDNISDQSILEQLVYDESIKSREYLIRKIQNIKVLEHLAMRESDPDVNRAAIERITNNTILHIIACNGPYREFAAARQIALLKQSESSLEKRTVAVLFENMVADLFVGNYAWPSKMTLYSDGIALFEGNCLVKKIAFKNYGASLTCYNYWWCSRWSICCSKT